MKQAQKTNKITQIVILITITFYKFWQQKITYNSLPTVPLIIILVVIIFSLLPTNLWSY